jgi:hypothetical protein
MPGRRKLAPSPVGECLDIHRCQRLVGCPQLRPSIGPSAFPPQPLAVEEPCARQFDPHCGAAQSLDRLPVQRVRRATVVEEGTSARLDPECPVRAAGPRHRRELLQCRRRSPVVPTADPGLHELGERPLRRPELERIRGCLRRCPGGFRVPAESVAQDGARPLRHVHTDAFASGDGIVETSFDQGSGLLVPSPHRRQTDLASPGRTRPTARSC